FTVFVIASFDMYSLSSENESLICCIIKSNGSSLNLFTISLLLSIADLIYSNLEATLSAFAPAFSSLEYNCCINISRYPSLINSSVIRFSVILYIPQFVVEVYQIQSSVFYVLSYIIQSLLPFGFVLLTIR